MIVNAHHVS